MSGANVLAIVLDLYRSNAEGLPQLPWRVLYHPQRGLDKRKMRL